MSKAKTIVLGVLAGVVFTLIWWGLPAYLAWDAGWFRPWDKDAAWRFLAGVWVLVNLSMAAAIVGVLVTECAMAEKEGEG